MTGNQFLVLLILVPLVVASLAVARGRFKPVPVIGASVIAELVMLVGMLLWSQSVQRAALSGHSSQMLAVASGGIDARRVIGWLVACVVAALLASVVLFTHRMLQRQ